MIEDLRNLLEESIKKNVAESLLLSGGLDTSIIAFVLARLKVKFLPVCVSLEGKGRDLEYVLRLKESLGINPIIVKVSIDEAESAIPEVVRIIKSFDPAIPNDLVVYFGVKRLREYKIDSTMTGDGADELFAGYDYMKRIENLEDYIEKISKNLSFNSDPIGWAFGVKVKRPYLEEEIISFAKRIPRIMKINGKWGKWILRKAYEGILPEDIIYQDKRPLEVGSGMSLLRNHIASKIRDEEYEEKKKIYGMRFYGKDHLYYFEIYRSIFGFVPEPKNGEITCPNCKAGKRSAHCRICGYVEEA